MTDEWSNYFHLQYLCDLHFIQAYSHYLDALNIKPTFANAWNNIAGLLMQWGDFNKAALYYKVCGLH
jgi:tetratricopeptide (TPR) repeat protein